jgi:cytidylate kinase
VHGLADTAAAERMVRDSDRARARFVKAVAGVNWIDAGIYDLAVDTSALGFDAVVDLIVRAVDARYERRLLGDSSRDRLRSCAVAGSLRFRP